MADSIQSLPGEIWKDLPEYVGHYRISTMGRIVTTKIGARLLQGDRGKHGYVRVKLCREGRVERRLVQHVVLEAFVGPRPAGMQCCHNNGVRDDNRLDNLRWDTRQSNEADKARHGTMVRGSAHPMSKISEADVVAIRALRASGEIYRVIAAKFKVSLPTIHVICARHTWRWVL